MNSLKQAYSDYEDRKQALEKIRERHRKKQVQFSKFMQEYKKLLQKDEEELLNEKST